jgi:hypothetical protein
MFLAFLEYFPIYFKFYRWMRGGNWKYVVCKFPAPINGCWVHNSEALWWELIEKEEQY